MTEITHDTREPKGDANTHLVETEILASLLQELEDEIAYVDMPDLPRSIELRNQQNHLSDLVARLHRLEKLRAPWLDLGNSRFRCLTYPLNLIMWPWSRKQAAFNTEIRQITQELTQMVGDTLTLAATTTNQDLRLSRMESWLRTLISQHEPAAENRERPQNHTNLAGTSETESAVDSVK